MVAGKCHGEVIPSPHAAQLPDAEHSIDHLHGVAENSAACRTTMTLTGLAGENALNTSACSLSACLLGSAVPSPSTPPAPCCSQSTHSGLQQVRVLRKLMPGKGLYMDVLSYILKAWKRCVMPAAIASCYHGSSCALLASRLSLT